MKNKVAFLVVSCDNYCDLWYPFFKTFHKYWSECPYQLYLASNFKQYEDEKVKNIPILMLTAKGEEEDKVKGLNTGAEDYMTKPFSFPELLARIKALLRRVKPNVVSDEAIYLDLRIDRESMKVFRKEKEITLGPKEYKLLNFLIKQPKRVYSRDQLLEHVWGDDINVESRTVDVHITRLRQAINIEGTKPLIRTVRSAGYSLEN